MLTNGPARIPATVLSSPQATRNAYTISTPLPLLNTPASGSLGEFGHQRLELAPEVLHFIARSHDSTSFPLYLYSVNTGMTIQERKRLTKR
jgi:hypothetical protein